MTKTELKDKLQEYENELKEQEKAPKTIKAYISDIELFLDYVGDEQDIQKSDVISYKEKLKAENRTPSTINRHIVSLNRFFKWAGADGIAGVKTVRTQTKTSLDGVMSVSDYERMLQAAISPGEQAQRAGKKPDLQAWAIMQTLANTGIRFNELQYFTVEALRSAPKNGKNAITVSNKGKVREIPISKELQKLLKDYCSTKGITSGYIFGTKNGTPISNEQISRRLKAIAGYARISKKKIHPHGFRHLFGKTYMQEIGRLDELADILGHSNLSTTRIYSRTTSKEKADNINRLGLIKKN